MTMPAARKNFLNARQAQILRRVVRHIKREPARYDQSSLIEKGKPGSDYYDISACGGIGAEQSPISSHRTFPDCGTVGCIAGWITILYAPHSRVDAVDFASKLLRLDESSAERLFSAVPMVGWTGWSEPYLSMYRNAKTLKQRARVLELRVEFFIKTGN